MGGLQYYDQSYVMRTDLITLCVSLDVFSGLSQERLIGRSGRR